MSQGDDLDFTAPLAEPGHSPEELRNIDDLGSIGAATLKDRGFYARVVTARLPERPRLPAECTVLVVEDDDATAMVIARALEKSGYRSRRAKDRAGIGAQLAARPLPDLVLLDVMLPDVNGFEVLNRIRHHGVVAKLPVILLTSMGEKKDIARGLALGADGYLTKPVLPSTLIDAVQSVLGWQG